MLATLGVVPVAVFPERLGADIEMSIFQSAKSTDTAAKVIDILTDQDLDDELAAAGISRFALN